jgi:CubicO group peptidase (beta-lactamase class C family)
VLALIAERASGVPFHDLVRARVTDPAGMPDTEFLRSDELPGRAAIGYLTLDSPRTNVFHTGDPVRGHGVEYALVLLGALLCLALGGAGDLSVDGRRLRQADSLALQRARIRRKF